MITTRRLGYLTLIVLCAAAAWAAASLALAHQALPVGENGAGYTIGARLALESSHVHDIWQGKTPKIVFRGRQHKEDNVYVWQQAKLVRPGNCMDVTPASAGQGPLLPAVCKPYDRLELAADRFYFSVSTDKSISLSVRTTPPGEGRMMGRGAMYQVEGMIGLGKTYDTATMFKIELSAPGLNIADLTATPINQHEPERDGDEEVGGCTDPREVRPSEPSVLALLPATPARLCRFRAKGQQKVLSLVQYQSGLMQRTRLTDTVMCRALLAQMLPKDAKTDVAGCIGAHWNAVERVELNLVLFEVTPSGQLALPISRTRGS